MKNRIRYKDRGLVFAHTLETVSGKSPLLGTPLARLWMNNRLTAHSAASGVKRMKAHGLRHTCATLCLASGVPPNVVQRRLGHKDITITLNIYSHALPSMQSDAAAKLAAVLHA